MRATPTRAAAYIRVSSEEQVEGYSLDAQTRAISLYAELHGLEIVRTYRDEGLSARTDNLSKRPAFAAMLNDADTNLFDSVVVHKLDRFSRNLRVTLDTLDRLESAGVGFVSITENMDPSTPHGRLVLQTLGGFAEFYSNNLSHETKKGKAERKRQGMYNGMLPFGYTKDEDGKPTHDPENKPGVLLAFQTAADGASDRQVAETLNAAGYRTNGNRGRNPWTKDSTRGLLQNRFYRGELPDGDGNWLPGIHERIVSEELFQAAMDTRRKNRRSSSLKVRRNARTFSLSGLGVCGHCGGPLHIVRNKAGARPRLYCYHRNQGRKCEQRSTFLDHYEEQIAQYLETFRLPPDFREQIISLYAKTVDDRSSVERQRREIENRLARLKDLYQWGDIEPDDYKQERDTLTGELAMLRASDDQSAALEHTAEYLADLSRAWRKASQEQRNELAQILFTEVVINDKRVEAVKPQPEYAPFFQLDYEERLKVLSSGSDGPRFSVSKEVESSISPCFGRNLTRVVSTPSAKRSIPLSRLDELRTRRDAGETLRDLATRFGCSHETVRNTLVRSGGWDDVS